MSIFHNTQFEIIATLTDLEIRPKKARYKDEVIIISYKNIRVIHWYEVWWQWGANPVRLDIRAGRDTYQLAFGGIDNADDKYIQRSNDQLRQLHQYLGGFRKINYLAGMEEAAFWRWIVGASAIFLLLCWVIMAALQTKSTNYAVFGLILIAPVLALLLLLWRHRPRTYTPQALPTIWLRA